MKKYFTRIFMLAFICSLPLHGQLMPPDSAWAEKTLASMTIGEKIGQLFMPVHTDLVKTLNWIKNYHIGGIWFPWTEATKITREINQLQLESTLPLLVSADFEKGVGTYVDGATDLPNNMALGASRDSTVVAYSAAINADEARAIGVHINFAPVLDINNNSKNPIINTRSYGEDPQLVARMGYIAAWTYQNHGILATGKHFPGHGNTSTDTHSKIGVVTSDTSQFESVELFPYTYILKRMRLSAIMSAHLWIKVLDSDTIPATLSYNAMTSLLRKRLNFKGVIYTDAMVMGGIASRYPFETAVVKAIQAGCDVILFPGSVEKGYDALLSAVQNGSLTESRIDESVRRILLSKTEAGIHLQRIVNPDSLHYRIGTPEHYTAAKTITGSCLTLVKDRTNLLPLVPGRKYFVVTITNKEGNAMLSRGLVNFPDEFRSLDSTLRVFRIGVSVSSEETKSVFQNAADADVIVVAAYIRIVLSSGTVELPPAHLEFIKKLYSLNKNIILISFGNPYIGASIPEIPAYICAYDNVKAMQASAAEALFGIIHFKGKLPITISEEMKFGAGIEK